MIELKTDALKTTKPHEYFVRFVFGGIACVLAGLMAKAFGPMVGGLFLAFPAIFPAGATLIEKHEKRRKARLGQDGTASGRHEAGIDAAGTTLGCVGLAAFAFVLHFLLPDHSPLVAIALAAAAWAAVSLALWTLLRHRLS